MSTESTRTVIGPSANGKPGPTLTSPRPRYGERIVLALLRMAAALSVVITVGIILVVFTEAIALFGIPGVSVVDFFTDTAWRPFTDPSSDLFRIGVLPLLNSTLLITAIALAIAVPLGLATAVYLSEYARPRVRRTVKPILELLAGVPTVVLGYFALTFMTPLLRAIFGTDVVPIFNAMSAGIVVGILIVPTIASISEDSMRAVPGGLREGAFGLGASKPQVVLRVVFPAALSGIVAALVLAASRAIGETVIVLVAGGASANLGIDPRESFQNMAAFIAQTARGDIAAQSVEFLTIFAVGTTLFVMTLILNAISIRFVRRFQQVYE